MSNESQKLIPPSICDAIRDAARGEAAFSIACRVFLEDASDSRPDEPIAEGRLEHAVARTILDAWLRGLGSAESVGWAYAAVGNRVAHGSHAA